MNYPRMYLEAIETGEEVVSDKVKAVCEAEKCCLAFRLKLSPVSNCCLDNE